MPSRNDAGMTQSGDVTCETLVTAPPLDTSTHRAPTGGLG
jgi:hypothetical protein